MKLSEIFQEGSDARKLFGKLYAVAAIGVIIAVLVLLASGDARRLMSVIIFPALGPVWLKRNPQTIGNAIDIGIVSDDLSDIQYRAIRKSGSSQALRVIFDHVPGRQCQFRGVIKHR